MYKIQISIYLLTVSWDGPWLYVSFVQYIIPSV